MSTSVRISFCGARNSMLRKRRSELVSCAPPRPVKPLSNADRHAVGGASRDVAHRGEEQAVLEHDVEDHLGLVHGGVRRHASVLPEAPPPVHSQPGRLHFPRVYTPSQMAQAPALPRGFELPLKQRLPRIGSIDQVAVEQRAAELAKRSIKKDVQGLGARARAALLRPDDARGPGHAGQGRRALLEGRAPRSERPDDPERRRGLRLSEPRSDCEGASRRQRRQGRERRNRVPVGAERRST